MIGKVMTGKAFRGCLLYCLNDKRQEKNSDAEMKDRAEVLGYNRCGGSDRELVQQFNEVRVLNTKLAKPVLHITLSLAEGEKLKKEKLTAISEACAREMGFQNNQWVAVLHHDTKHPHLHIVANRVGFDGRTVTDSNSYKRIALFCRKMEREHELQQVLSPKAFLSQKDSQLPRLDKRKEQLRKDVKECLLLSKSFEQFEGLMKRKKISMERGRGIVFTDEKKMRVKGSELGFSLATIAQSLARRQGLSVEENKQEKHVHISTDKQGQMITKSGIAGDGNFLVQKISREAMNILNQMIKPQFPEEGIAPELKQEIRKKKRKLRHE